MSSLLNPQLKHAKVKRNGIVIRNDKIVESGETVSRGLIEEPRPGDEISTWSNDGWYRKVVVVCSLRLPRGSEQRPELPEGMGNP